MPNTRCNLHTYDGNHVVVVVVVICLCILLYLSVPQRVDCKTILERAVDGAPSQIPTLKFLTPLPPSPILLGHDLDLGHRIKIPVTIHLCLLFVRTRTKFGIKTLKLTLQMKFHDI